MKVIYKSVDLSTEKGIKQAERLKANGWKVNAHGIDTIQFYRVKPETTRRAAK